jgi:hypothetical protein
MSSHASARLFWVLTIQWEGRAGKEVRTVSGTVDRAPGTTRQDVYEAILGDASERVRATDPVVLFFSLESNRT